MPQIPAHMKKVRPAGQTQVNKALPYLRDILKKVHCADMHACLKSTICLPWSHTPSATHTHSNLCRKTLKFHYWQDGYEAL